MSEVIESGGSGAVRSEQLLQCWSCKGPVDRRALFCHTCAAIQPPHGIDHFARLGLAARFDVAPEEIERNYFGFQRILHPDRFAAKSAREKALSQAQAAALNDAYETLRDPVRRAIHLLERLGAPMPGDDHTIADPELLMEAMEARETLAEARTAEAIDALVARADADADRTKAELTDRFDDGDLDAARTAVLRLRYLDKLRDEARTRRTRLERA